MTSSIGTLNEKSLHAALKAWLLQPGDRTEVPLDGYVIDIVRGDLLIEVQTRNVSAIKTKLRRLTARHPVRLVYPIAQQKWIVKLPTDEQGVPVRRKSPKRGTLLQLFDELVSIPDLLARPTFSLEVLLIQEEEVRRHDVRRAWRRRGWVTQERRLMGFEAAPLLTEPADLERLIPGDLAESFTTADLARALPAPRRSAQKMAYCLSRMGVLTREGKRGNAVVYRVEI